MKYSIPMRSTVLAVDLAPQRPKPVREQAELPNHILEPAWEGTRVLVRIGHPGPRFVGYDGPVEGPRELGDIVICPQHTVDLREAIVHGALHLAGMDHETDDGEMLALQRELMSWVTHDPSR